MVMPSEKDIISVKLKSKSLVRILALATLPLTTPVAWGQSAPDHALSTGQTDIAKASGKRSDRLVVVEASHPPPPGAFSPGPHAGNRLPPPPLEGRPGAGRSALARDLAALETEIGIRSHQVDAWRDFTDALLAVTAPPQPPAPPTSDAGRPALPKPEPFRPTLMLANDAAERGRNAEKLIAAIGALRSVLTPAQLEKVVALEVRLAPPPGGPRPPFGHSPGQPGPHPERGPGPDQPGSVPTSPPR